MRDGYTVKICGVTNQRDRNLAALAGADYFGVVVETSYSPRSQTQNDAAALMRDAPIPGIALVYQPQLEWLQRMIDRVRPQGIQFLSPVPLEWLNLLKSSFKLKLWQSVHLPAVEAVVALDESRERQQLLELARQGVDVIVVDTVAIINGVSRFGGTGKVADWGQARRMVELASRPVLLAGGINPDNVQTALRQVNPAGIDLCSGVERTVGQKDSEKMFRLIRLVRECEREEKGRRMHESIGGPRTQ